MNLQIMFESVDNSQFKVMVFGVNPFTVYINRVQFMKNALFIYYSNIEFVKKKVNLWEISFNICQIRLSLFFKLVFFHFESIVIEILYIFHKSQASNLQIQHISGLSPKCLDIPK